MVDVYIHGLRLSDTWHAAYPIVKLCASVAFSNINNVFMHGMFRMHICLWWQMPTALVGM